MASERNRAIIRAAMAADWIQVSFHNGKPPCFAIPPEEDGSFRERFCLRADYWAGHHPTDGDFSYPHHRFISLAELLEDISE